MTTQITLVVFLSVLSIGGGLIGLIALLWGVFSQDDVGQRLEVFATVPTDNPSQSRRRSRTQLNRFRNRLNNLLSNFVSPQLTLQLMAANWPITETEFILIRFWSVVLSFFGGWLFVGLIYPGIGLALVSFILPTFLLNRSIQKRRQEFEKQFLDALILLKGAIKIGYSFLQSLDIVIDEMKPPISDEFRRVRRETMLGLPLSQALLNLHERMQNDDLYMVITAVNINAQTGGNQTLMLEAVTKTIRDRVRLFREVRALTSQQRFTGYMLSLMPFGVAAFLFVVNPKYISKIFQPNIYLCFPIGALILILIGNLVIRKLVQIKV
jgi:tight adherence protein B